MLQIMSGVCIMAWFSIVCPQSERRLVMKFQTLIIIKAIARLCLGVPILFATVFTNYTHRNWILVPRLAARRRLKPKSDAPMKVRFSCAIYVLAIAFFASSCSPPPQPTAASPSVEPALVPVTEDALTGDWARVLVITGTPQPQFDAYWLRFTTEGTFFLTTNKQFETNLTQTGTYALAGDILTLSATTGSQKCEGESATYQVTIYEGGTMAFKPIAVPCAQWLNMGEGNLGEDAIWLRLED